MSWRLGVGPSLFRAAPLEVREQPLDLRGRDPGGDEAVDEPLGVRVARRIKNRIKEVTGLTASAGVAPNKLVAKIASGYRKPDGLTVVPPERVDSFLRDLPVDVLWGVGPKTAARLEAVGIKTVADLRRPVADLRPILGSSVEWLVPMAHGVDDRPVSTHHERKSVGSENTFDQDLTDAEEIRAAVATLARDLAEWLARKARVVRTVTLKVRYRDFQTITRSDTRRPATRDAEALASRAVALLERTEAGPRPVRLLGVSYHGFGDGDDADDEPVAVEGGPRVARGQLLLPFGVPAG